MLISYSLQFIDSTRFMANSLSILDVNLAEGFHKIKCKYGMIISNLKYEKLYTENVSGALNTEVLKI